MNLEALSLAPAVNAWLADSRQPSVLHVFDQACNLINERREVLSLVTPQIGNGPFNLVIEDDISFSEHIDIESVISIGDHHILLGDLTINLTNANLWNPRPDWEGLHANKENILAQIAQLPITNYQFPTSLISALTIADIQNSQVAAQKLAGLGQGLTPAGDDLIMGAIYAVWIVHPHKVASVLAKEVTDTASPLTTSLSAAWLRAAGKGEAGSLWHDFFDALISVDQGSIQKARDKILAVGETSGADALAGFVSVCRSWLQSAARLAIRRI